MTRLERHRARMGWILYKVMATLLYESKGLVDDFHCKIADKELERFRAFKPFQKRAASAESAARAESAESAANAAWSAERAASAESAARAESAASAASAAWRAESAAYVLMADKLLKLLKAA